VIYRIDSNDRLVYADGDFQRFAEASGEPELTARWLGQPLWHCIRDEDLRAVFVALVGRARAGHSLSVNTRCDSPGAPRAVVMRIAPVGDGGVEFRCELAEARTAPTSEPSTCKVLRVCAWCYRADRDGWRDIEDVVATEQLLERPTVPPVTHGICDACMNETAAELDALTAA
jgi:hypothetical protein